ncbi:antirestriction protein ArdA [Intestinimonas butyriciproducens]|uniref:antirestriction protein ArdA n=1 Tax=Intestinimonas butyriciproducens TaxID=1297617 RepID=UPI0018A0BFAF|nr:antirestriction protein ArdA [Intestinimonas butyriciproducens]
MPQLGAFVTNLGKYNEGTLAGEWLHLPAETEEVQALLKRIGVDGVRYEEIFITDYESDLPGLTGRLGEYESIDELNHLAHVLDDLDKSDLEKYEAVLDMGEYTGSVKNLINLAQNLDCFEYYPGITNGEELGRMYIEDFEALQIPEHLIDYIDYEAYGRDVRINEGGYFADNGYVMNNNSRFVELYSGRDDIPEEHCIFAYPQLNIREQMAAYKEVIDRSALDTDKHRGSPAYKER